jgi:Flp pilus assembly protein TadD
MGDVFLARDTRLDRLVAVKFLSRQPDSDTRRRLMSEARAIAALDHPAICAVYDVASDPSAGDFIVMQYVEGETLASRLASGPLPADDALRIAIRIAEALAVAHARGIVHRDLKPRNIMIGPDGAPRLLDFGVARRLIPPSDIGAQTTATAMTNPDTPAGTPAYMAPEQIDGHTVDGRADLFSLGCVLYECLTGRRAFGGQTPYSVYHQVLHGTPAAPSTIVPGLGAGHDAVCDLLMRKAPRERPPSATAAREALETVLRGSTLDSDRHVAPRPPATVSRRALLLVAGAVAVILAAGWLWSYFSSARVPAGARKWYEDGVAALREGSYATAKSRFEFAIREFPDYALAHARLADALTELDDLDGAKDALLRVNQLMSQGSRMSGDDLLRFDAVRASALRDHAAAIKAYRALAARAPSEAERWIDVGRAEEAASKRVEAREAYRRAVELDSKSAAARLRHGVMQAQDGDAAAATVSFDEAERLFRAATNVEGEAETSLRRSVMLLNRGDAAAAETAVTPVVTLGQDPRFVALGLRARFHLARIEIRKRNFERAEALATTAVREAGDRGLHKIAALGLIDAGLGSLSAGRFQEAEERTSRAEALAREQKAALTEHRARLQLASIKGANREPAEALKLAEGTLPFFEERQYVRNAAEARIIASRAHEALGNVDAAMALAKATLDVATSIRDTALKALALESLAGLAAQSGRLAEALVHRETIEREHEAIKDDSNLPYDIRSRADLLITMGRAADARAALNLIDERIAAGRTAYNSGRVPVLKARLAVIEGQFRDVAGAAPAAGTADANARQLGVMAEYARARLGLRGQTAAAIAAWPDAGTSPASKQDLGWWAAATLLARGDAARAFAVSHAVLTGPEPLSSPEVSWRLAAVASIAAARLGRTADATALKEQAKQARALFFERWAASETDRLTYLRRADLAGLPDVVK